MSTLQNVQVRPNSQKIYEESSQYIPGGVNSPIRACLGIGITPLIIDHALGSSITDVDGNTYLDFCCSWGALIHGHAHPYIEKEVYAQMRKGTSYGIATPIELEFAKKIQFFMPSIEKVRFVSSGTEATMTAVRIARGYTKKQYVIKFAGNYHGHADMFLVQAGSGVSTLPGASSSGVPQSVIDSTLCLPYNDVRALEELCQNPKFANDIACIIVEAVPANMGVVPPTEEFLQCIQDMCKKQHIVLIFDEVITGFRIAKGGAQYYYALEPDLTCLGKIIGAGFPVAAVGGKKALMDCLAPIGTVFQAGTLSGNPVAMRAGYTALSLIDDTPLFYDNLQMKADTIINPVKAFIQKHNLPVALQHVSSLFSIFFGVRHVENFDEAKSADNKTFKEFFIFMLEHGIYIPPLQLEAWFISSSHSLEELERVQKLVIEFLNQKYMSL